MTTPTPEAIEAAARAIYDVRDDPYDDDEWDDLDSSDREEFMCQARAALSAAAPFIAAQAKAEALREAADALKLPGTKFSGDTHLFYLPVSDGYSEASKDAEQWLRARAATIEAEAS